MNWPAFVVVDTEMGLDGEAVPLAALKDEVAGVGGPELGELEMGAGELIVVGVLGVPACEDVEERP